MTKKMTTMKMTGNEAGAAFLAPRFRCADFLRALGRFRRRKLHHRDDLVGAGDDPAAHVARLEARQDAFADDDARHRVGQEDARAIAGLDPHLALVGRDQQDDAVVLLLVADPPGAAEPIAIILDRPPLEAVDRRDDELPARRRLERFGLRTDVDDLRGRQQVRLVDDPAGELGKGLGVGRRWRRQAPPATGRRGSGSPQPAVLKSTVGASCAPEAASNGTLGLAP